MPHGRQAFSLPQWSLASAFTWSFALINQSADISFIQGTSNKLPQNVHVTTILILLNYYLIYYANLGKSVPLPMLWSNKYLPRLCKVGPVGHHLVGKFFVLRGKFQTTPNYPKQEKYFSPMVSAGPLREPGKRRTMTEVIKIRFASTCCDNQPNQYSYHGQK